MSKPTKECLFTKDAPISAVELRKSHPTEEVDEQTLFADAARPLRAVPPCHHGAADAHALQAWRYAGRPDGRVLHAACVQGRPPNLRGDAGRSEEHTSELQSLMRISYAVFCLKKKKKHT